MIAAANKSWKRRALLATARVPTARRKSATRMHGTSGRHKASPASPKMRSRAFGRCHHTAAIQTLPISKSSAPSPIWSTSRAVTGSSQSIGQARLASAAANRSCTPNAPSVTKPALVERPGSAIGPPGFRDSRQGLDTLVRSAINGHGGMPARGGLANLTDSELRSAIVYMFNPVTAPTLASSPPSAVSARTLRWSTARPFTSESFPPN